MLLNRLILEAARAGAVPRVHGNGFMQLDLSPRVRLHVWGDERIPRQTKPTPIHDHTFGFTSLILRGGLKNIRYDAESVARNEQPTHQGYQAVVRQGEDTVLQPVVTAWYRMHMRAPEFYEAGATYRIEREEVHESIPLPRVVTVSVICKDEPVVIESSPPPWVFVSLDGEGVDNEFNRYDALSLPVRWHIICGATGVAIGQLPKSLWGAADMGDHD
jgi:virulence-associated protein VagC